MNQSLTALAAATVLSCGWPSAAQEPASAHRTVYVTVTDRDGLAVEDMSAADFEVKEGGKLVQIVEAAAATEPLQIALIVDDNGTGFFRSPLARFVQRMDGLGVMSLRQVTGQSMKLVDYTANVDTLLQAIATLNARPGSPDGGQLLEGISEAAVELRRREATRPLIIALTVGGEEHSTANSDHVLAQLRQSGATLHVFSVANSAMRATVTETKPSALLQENMHLGRVLGDGPKQSGGRHELIVASSGFLVGLQNLASELTRQYRITYSLPAGVKRSDKLSVSSKRRGIQVRAPSRIPS